MTDDEALAHAKMEMMKIVLAARVGASALRLVERGLLEEASLVSTGELYWSELNDAQQAEIAAWTMTALGDSVSLN